MTLVTERQTVEAKRWSRVMSSVCVTWMLSTSRGVFLLASSSRVGQLCYCKFLTYSWPRLAGPCAALSANRCRIERELVRACPGPNGRYGQLATARNYKAQGRWKERLLCWRVREDSWVVATPDGQVLVEELRSSVDAAPVSLGDTRSQGCRRCVAVSVSELTRPSESVGSCVLVPSPANEEPCWLGSPTVKRR